MTATKMNLLKNGKLGKPRSLKEFVFYIDQNEIKLYVAKTLENAEKSLGYGTFYFINFELGKIAEDCGPASLIEDYRMNGYTVVTFNNYEDFKSLKLAHDQALIRRNKLKKLRRIEGSGYIKLKRGPKGPHD